MAIGRSPGRSVGRARPQIEINKSSWSSEATRNRIDCKDAVPALIQASGPQEPKSGISLSEKRIMDDHIRIKRTAAQSAVSSSHGRRKARLQSLASGQARTKEDR